MTAHPPTRHPPHHFRPSVLPAFAGIHVPPRGLYAGALAQWAFRFWRSLARCVTLAATGPGICRLAREISE